MRLSAGQITPSCKQAQQRLALLQTRLTRAAMALPLGSVAEPDWKPLARTMPVATCTPTTEKEGGQASMMPAAIIP